MSKVRVYEVAKQLNMDQKTLVAIFQSMGFGDVRNHMSAVEADVVERVKRHLERQKSPEVVEERIRPTVVKRRARPAEAEPLAPPVEVPARSPAPDRGSTRGVMPPAPGSQQGFDRAQGHDADGPVRRAPPPAPSSRGRAPVEEEARSPEPSHAAAEPINHQVARAEMPPPPPSQPAVMIPPPAPSAPRMAAIPPAPPSGAGLKSGPSAAEQPGPTMAESPAAGAAPPAPESAPRAAGPSPGRAVEQEQPIEAAPQGASAEPARADGAGRAAAADDGPQRGAQDATAGREATQPLETAAPREAAAPRAGTPPPRQGSSPSAPGRGTIQSRRDPPPAPGAAATPPASTPPRRPSSPPKTGIDVWQGRPGVPMPAARTTPPARRTTYDPRANTTPARPGAGFGPAGRQMGNRGRPGFRPRPGAVPKRPAHVSTQEMASHKKVIKIEEQVSLQQLAGKMSLKSTDVLMRLISMGMTGVNINSTLDAETAKILAGEFGWAVEDVAMSEEATIAAATDATEEGDADFEIRPPIVTVMGHVDHGKTSLLDRIRKASVAEGEAGGITQHIGAYRVETSRGTIAFLDTPGHEAFTAMRARGASLTDLVILVVAADDGVMPQTREAIAHAKVANVPIIVAVNKIDKPGADAEKIKRELATLGLQTEEWGGDTMFAHVSAKTGEGVDQLLEGVLLQAEVLELKSYPQRKATGVVIEALLDRGRGPVARVMIQDGTLRAGDILLAGAAWGKVRAMTDELGRNVAEAGPATPVEVLGLNEVPSAGDPVHAVKDAATAQEIAETRRKKASKTLIPQDSRVSLEALTSRLSEADQLELKLIIKGDVQGSVEAVGQALVKLTTTKVKVTIVHAAVGAITEGDVNLAVASKAIITGFNVRPAGKSAALAESEGVEIRLYNIIYNAVDDIRSAMEGLLPATKIEKILGRAEVRQLFRSSKAGAVAGCMVTQGTIKRAGEARLIRDNIVVWTGKVGGLRRFKDDVKEVAEGMECGISLEGFGDQRENDVIESFEIEEVKTKL
jgi:translation initiation factor IF-2